MASEAVRKILEAETDSDNKNAEARKRGEETVMEAERYAAVAVQKKLGEAAAEMEKIRADYNQRAEEYSKKAEEEYNLKIAQINEKALKNYEKAIEAIINGFF